MAKSSSFGYKNDVASEHVITPIKVRPVTNYAKISDEPTYVELQNRTCPLDQGELLTFRANKVDHVSTAQTVQHPNKVRSGIQYVIKLEEILRTTDDNANIICDEPVVAYLTIRHERSGNITSDLVAEVVERLLGAARDQDGKWRFDDLMRSALVPVTD